MHVLVCDDDTATRFVIHRLLVQKLNCTVSECGDGVEALQRLATGDVDLLILDITMPTLDGLDVLEAIRCSPQLGSLPVIMLSQERREEVVVKLIKLGILGYVVKPPRAEALTTLVERARHVICRQGPTAGLVGAREIRLDHDTPALLVDGSAEFRSFFAAQSEPYGRIITADSGLDALASFKHAPTGLVFVGDELGVVGAELLIRKLHAMRADRPLRIVGVRHTNSSEPTSPGFDDVMPRSLVPAVHRAELRRFVRVTGPLDAASPVIGDLSDALTSAATQVFGTMLDSEIQVTTTESCESELCATVEITVQHFLVRVDLHLALQDGRVFAARMRSSEPDTVSDEDITSSVAELANLLAGRFHAGLDARSIESVCAPPRVNRHESTQVDEPPEGHGVRLQFTATAAHVAFTLLARVERRAQEARGVDRASADAA